MKNARILIGVAVAVLILTSAAFAQDWPQWRGVNRDGKAINTGKMAASPANPTTWTQLRKVTVGLGDSTPALVGNKLYVFTRQGAEEVTLCIDVNSGKEIWRSGYPAEQIGGPSAGHGGPRSSPAVANGKVVTLGIVGTVRCLDAATGKELWRNIEYQGAVPMFYTAMSPIIVDKMAILHLGGKDNGAIVAFDLATGVVKWKTPGDGPSYSSPVLMMVGKVKQLVFLTDKNLEGVAVADGKVLWQVAAPTQKRFYNSATPIVEGQTVICTGQGSGTKAVKVERQGDVFTTKELWSNPDLGCGFSTTVLEGGFLYGLSDKGSFFCINAKTGQTAWVDTTTRKESDAGIVDVGAAVYALPSDGQMVVFKTNPKAYEEVSRNKVSDTPVYASLIVSGNRVFTKDQDTVTMWTVK